MKSFDRFQLHDQGVSHLEIKDVTVFNPRSLVVDREGKLAAVFDATQGKLVRKAPPVSLLQKSGPKKAMHLDCCPDHPFTKGIGWMFDQSHSSSRTETSETGHLAPYRSLAGLPEFAPAAITPSITQC